MISLDDIRKILEALSLAEERIEELSGWAKVPAEGETLDSVRIAKEIASLVEEEIWRKTR